MKKILIFLLLIMVWIGCKIGLHLSLVNFINHSFLVGIIGLMLGACFIIFQSGFLSLFFHGFKTVGSFVAPQSRAMERVNRLVEEDEGWQTFKRNFSRKLAALTFLIGFSSITASLLGLIFY